VPFSIRLRASDIADNADDVMSVMETCIFISIVISYSNTLE